MVPAFRIRSFSPVIRSGSVRTHLTGGEINNSDYEECYTQQQVSYDIRLYVLSAAMNLPILPAVFRRA